MRTTKTIKWQEKGSNIKMSKLTVKMEGEKQQIGLSI
jgi:hypothetical protein